MRPTVIRLPGLLPARLPPLFPLALLPLRLRRMMPEALAVKPAPLALEVMLRPPPKPGPEATGTERPGEPLAATEEDEVGGGCAGGNGNEADPVPVRRVGDEAPLSCMPLPIPIPTPMPSPASVLLPIPPPLPSVPLPVPCWGSSEAA